MSRHSTEIALYQAYGAFEELCDNAWHYYLRSWGDDIELLAMLAECAGCEDGTLSFLTEDLFFTLWQYDCEGMCTNQLETIKQFHKQKTGITK